MNLRVGLQLVVLAFGASGCVHSNATPYAKRHHHRIVSTPSSIAFVSSAGETHGLGGEVRFGGPLGRSALYLKFPSEWRSQGAPQQAFLTLAPRAGSALSDRPVTLEAWRISGDWQPLTLQRWSEKPSLLPPFARARNARSAAEELRIDVTELVRFAAQNPERDFGIAVIARGSDGPAATFSTGFSGGRAPRLEVYVR